MKGEKEREKRFRKVENEPTTHNSDKPSRAISTESDQSRTDLQATWRNNSAFGATSRRITGPFRFQLSISTISNSRGQSLAIERVNSIL